MTPAQCVQALSDLFRLNLGEEAVELIAKSIVQYPYAVLKEATTRISQKHERIGNLAAVLTKTCREVWKDKQAARQSIALAESEELHRQSAVALEDLPPEIRGKHEELLRKLLGRIPGGHE